MRAVSQSWRVMAWCSLSWAALQVSWMQASSVSQTSVSFYIWCVLTPYRPCSVGCTLRVRGRMSQAVLPQTPCTRVWVSKCLQSLCDAW